MTLIGELQAHAKGLHHDARDVDIRTDIRDLSRQLRQLAEDLATEPNEAVRVRAAHTVHSLAAWLQRLDHQARRLCPSRR